MLVGFGDQSASETCQGSCWLILHSLMEASGWICSPYGSYTCQGECLGALLVAHTRDFAFNASAPTVTPMGPAWARLAGRTPLTLSHRDLCLLRKHQEPTHLKIIR